MSAYQAAAKARIDAELNARVAQWFPSLSPPHREALHSILVEGKRLRGSLTCLVAEALGATFERALPAAFAVEVIQAASLVHDDFVDGDTTRRGRPAAWTQLSARRAVLLADLMFATAIEKMTQLGPREGETLARAIAAMAQGALQESLGMGKVHDAEAYRSIIQLKTGSLFAAAARLGALAAGAHGSILEAATRFGAVTGEVYQIADDLADGDMGAPELLQAKIAPLVEQARTALAAFPRNEHTSMLLGVIDALKRSPNRMP
ncbi:MAG TPA: polyprenyl synthetase family protein [Burkholderiales bacterium]|nr:polyprenyl synthetase family protein [Burkholderiales bacterium]